MAPVTPFRAAFVIVFVAVAAGCSPAPPVAPQVSPPSPPPDPVTVCVNQLTHWAAEDLSGNDREGYDYQHRGLTAQQADALRAIVAEAQALGPDRAAGVVAQRIRAECERIAGTPGR